MPEIEFFFLHLFNHRMLHRSFLTRYKPFLIYQGQQTSDDEQ